MTISLWQDSGQDRTRHQSDVVIAGAGVTGASCAWWLKRRGLSCIVLDSGKPGSGSTGRSAGFVLRSIVAYYNRVVNSYGRETARYIFSLIEETQKHLLSFDELHEHSIEMERCGSYLLAASLEELKDLEESAELMREDGFVVEYLRKDPLDRDFYGALSNPCDLALNPGLLVETLLAVSGAQVFSGEQVWRVESHADGTVSCYTPKKVVSAGKMIVSAGAYLPLLFPSLAGAFRIERGQILVTRPLTERLLDRICYANYGYEYFRQLHDGRFLLGGCREPFRHEELGYADFLNPKVQQALSSYLKDRFPEVAGVPIDYRWSGPMAFTADGLPLVGSLPEKENVYFTAGCNGHGLGWSLALARLLVEVALDGATPGIFDAARGGVLQNPGATTLAI